MKRERGEKRGEWGVRMRRWELWMRDEKWVGEEWRETSKRGVRAALVMALYAVHVCVLCITNYFIKVLLQLFFLFVFVQKVPLECNNSRSLSHTYTLIHHSAWWEVWSKPVLTTCIFQEGDYNSKQGKTHTNKTVCRTSGACEEVSGKTSYDGKFCF